MRRQRRRRTRSPGRVFCGWATLASMVALRRVALVVCLFALDGCEVFFSVADYEGPKPSDAGGTDAALTGFCPSGAIFCDDFERTNVLGPGVWDTEDVTTGATLAIISGTPTGRALDCRLSQTSAQGRAVLVKATSANVANELTIQHDFEIASGAGSVHMNEVLFRGSGSYSIVFPYYNAGSGLMIAEVVCGGPCTYRQSAPFSFAPGGWHHLALAIDFTTTPAKYTLTLDGRVVLQASSQAGAKPGTVELHGGAYTDPNAAADVTIDELVVTGN